MPELGSYGSVRVARGNSGIYRERFEGAARTSASPPKPDILLHRGEPTRRVDPRA
jgi:hypothetical protein